MKILYARPAQAIELDYRNASVNSLGTDLRLGIVEAMIQLGHEVSFGTTVAAKEANLLMTGKTLAQDAGQKDFDYSFLKKIKPFTRPEDYDLLFIEGSSTNTTFVSGGDKIPDAQRFYELISNFRGKVILYQHGDHQLALPFGHAFGTTDSESSFNASNIYKCIEGLSEGKVWKIFTHAADVRAFLDAYNTKAFQYRNIDIPVEHKAIGYSENFDRPLNGLKPFAEREWDIIYVGSQRKGQHRTKKLMKFLANTGLKVKVIGKWEWTGVHEGIFFAGQQGKHGDVYDLYQDGKCVMQLADNLFEKCGMVTTRVVQAIRSGCVLFADADIKGSETYARPVADQEQLLRDIAIVKLAAEEGELSPLLEAQVLSLKTWDKTLKDVLENDNFGPIKIENMEGERAPRQVTASQSSFL